MHYTSKYVYKQIKTVKEIRALIDMRRIGM